MTMPASGALSLGDTPSVSANRELGKAYPYRQTITMNDTDLRSLAGVGGSGTPWSMNSLYGKSSITINNSLQAEAEGNQGSVSFTFNDNGTMYYYDPLVSSYGSANWATPTTAGIGSNYWVKITRGSGAYVLGMTSGTLYQIVAAPYSPTAYLYVGVGQFQASSGTVDIYSNAAGTVRVGGGTYNVFVQNSDGPEF